MTGACFSIFPQVPWASQETCSNIQAKIQIVSLTLVWSINLLSCKLANDLPLLVPFQVGFGVLGGILVWFGFCFFSFGGRGRSEREVQLCNYKIPLCVSIILWPVILSIYISRLDCNHAQSLNISQPSLVNCQRKVLVNSAFQCCVSLDEKRWQ